MKKVIKTAINSGTDWRFELISFLRAYRNTPHSSTNKSPAQLLFINSITSRLPYISTKLPSHHSNSIKFAKIFDEYSKHKMKSYADKRRKATHHNFRVGDKVIYHQLNKKIQNKYLNKFSSIEYKIRNIKGSMITVVDSNGREFTRNSSFFKTISSNLNFNHDSDDIQITENLNNNNIENLITNTNTIIASSPSRDSDTTSSVITTTPETINNINNNTASQPVIQQAINLRPIRTNRNTLPARYKDFEINRK